ncbi:hypothetical protein BKA81DRAFT_347366 [Phyllosticta paracitricarpa]
MNGMTLQMAARRWLCRLRPRPRPRSLWRWTTSVNVTNAILRTQTKQNQPGPGARPASIACPAWSCTKSREPHVWATGPAESVRGREAAQGSMAYGIHTIQYASMAWRAAGCVCQNGRPWDFKALASLSQPSSGSTILSTYLPTYPRTATLPPVFSVSLV